ncbi:DUF4236 domain-containing protein [Stutzerimonas nitrititolerans]|uniref:DUF4236 domain-containing protein n=1 Tax=Stutzerimonas nitrititolerans TaxID=2482751 RepID=UPI00289BA813|nr:DUF4236 domain-containing protein [Stutzerimonas nitrititolerans]
MAIRFRKSIKIAPGVRLNVSKSGLSTSIGGKGATVNVSKRGTRVTAGIPGTGLSASQLYKSSAKKRTPAPPPEYSPAEWAVAAISLEIISVLCWVYFSGALSFIGAVVTLAIPSIYIARWMAKSREADAIQQELARLVNERTELEAQVAPTHSSIGNKHVEIGEPCAARSEPTIQRMIATESSDDDVPASRQAALLANDVDYLGQAALAGRNAKDAVKACDFDKAWRLFHDQKQLFLQHAQQQGWAARETLALDASVHEDLADVLRLEKRHTEALPHILYWVAASRHRPIKRHVEKLRAYFNRCKLTNTSLEEVEAYLSSRKDTASYPAIQRQVKRWIQAG